MRQTARLHRKVAAQRTDTGRKRAKRVVRDHDAIAVEDFRPRFLAKTTMARKAADAAIGATKKALVEIGRKHGRTRTRIFRPCGLRSFRISNVIAPLELGRCNDH